MEMRSPSIAAYTRALTDSARLLAVLTIFTLFAASATAQNPVPFIDQPLVPDATAPGGPAFTLTVNGAGFVPASVVNWNGSPRATTFVSSSRLTAAILATDTATASTATITVVNPRPGGGVSNAQFFSITVPASSVSFVGAVTYSSGSGDSEAGTSSIAVADVNGDGIPDLLVAGCSNDSLGCGYTSGEVGVLLGNGDGTFQPVVTYNAAPEVRLLQAELVSRSFQGIISLHTDDTSAGFYGFAHGATLTKDLDQTRAGGGGKILPRDGRPVIDGFNARNGIIRDSLRRHLEPRRRKSVRVRSRSFWKRPATPPEYLKELAFVAALQTILLEYHKFIAYAPNL